MKDYDRSSLGKNLEINLMTAYSVHESTVADESCERTFVRLEFSRKTFNRVGNSVNELFDTGWEYVDLSIPDHLKIEKFD